MGHYTKLAVLAMRSMGLMILMYAGPMILYGLARVALGAKKASDGVTSSDSALLGWMLYGVGGLLLFFLARRLGKIASRGLDDSPSIPPAP